MRINNEGLWIVKHFEGYREEPYLCSAGVPTIGYGTCFYPDGTNVNLDDKPINKQLAIEFLVYGLQASEHAVARLVRSPLNENQFSSLVSFIYNIGASRFKSSTLRSKLNRRDYVGASNEFWKWRRAAGRILKGLVLRRKREQILFDKKIQVENG